VLWKILEGKKEDLGEGWRNLCNYGLSNLYFSPYMIRAIKSRTVRYTVHMERRGYLGKAYINLIGTTGGRLMCRWENESQRNRIRGCELIRNWVQGHFIVNTAMNLLVRKYVGNFLPRDYRFLKKDSASWRW
jgi:hypothetical protein